MSMSQYEYQKYLKKANGEETGGNGYGYTHTSSGFTHNQNTGRYYVPGMGYFENEPLITTDENGQRVVQTSGLQREGKLTADGGLSREGGDRLAKAYDYAKSGLSETLKRWQRSRNAGVADNYDLTNLYRNYKSNGLYDGDFAGFEDWLDSRLAQAERETMNVSALHNSRGTATKSADGSQQLINGRWYAKNDDGSGWTEIRGK